MHMKEGAALYTCSIKILPECLLADLESAAAPCLIPSDLGGKTGLEKVTSRCEIKWQNY